jgi:hypothetical protein
MPRYYFHLYNDVVARDDEGRILSGLNEARSVAVKEAREMMTESVLDGRMTLSHRIDVADESGAVVATVSFRDAVTVND